MRLKCLILVEKRSIKLRSLKIVASKVRDLAVLVRRGTTGLAPLTTMAGKLGA